MTNIFFVLCVICCCCSINTTTAFANLKTPARGYQKRNSSLSISRIRDNTNRNSFSLASSSQYEMKEGGVEEKSKSVYLNALELCLCGAIATIIGDFVMHPIDTIKITQQTAVVAKGMIATVKDIILLNGPLGLYQGVVPYLVGDGISGAVKFATFEIIKRFTETALPAKWHGLSQFLCAAVAMLACSVVLVPAEVLKTRLQAGQAASLLSAITTILRTEGLIGFFAGYYATLVRDVPYTMLELGMYENLKQLLKKLRKSRSEETNNNRDELLAAAITGGITAFLTTPLDLVKTKMMIQSGSNIVYHGVFDALRSIYSKGGLAGLFVGAAARVAWLLPFTTIYLGVYEATKRRFIQWKTAKKMKRL